MLARFNSRRPIVLSGLAVAFIAVLAVAPSAGAEVAQSSDQAGSDYATAIAKAKKKRADRVKKCNKKPKKAKRAACKKSANRAFQKAKEAAQDKRDEARSADPDAAGDPPSSPADEYRECVEQGGDPRECKEGARGEKGAR